jgi:uncharacterized membrane protein YfcA
MPGPSFDPATLVFVIAGALVAGFTTGFAGFGTGLVASGFWFHVLPAAMVPPLVALASVAGQIVGFVTVRKAFDWVRLMPFLIGAAVGIPLGVAALAAVSPFWLKMSAGAFLVVYSAYQLLARRQRDIGDRGGRWADGVVGIGGGFLGGFAGLSAPLPVMWLQLRGGPPDSQRAVYQPFNLIVLALASVAMGFDGQITPDVLWIALFALPVTLAGAGIGARLYGAVSPRTFQRLVLLLLLASGAFLIAQALA